MNARKTLRWGLASLLLLAAGAFALNAASSERKDCPGKIVCPINGETICQDQCPLIDPNRPDCPGKILCPLTGEMICQDQCPVGGEAAECSKLAADTNRFCCSDTKAAKD